MNEKFYNNHKHHSILINEHFDLNHNGVDYINRYDKQIEFKETLTCIKDNQRITLKPKDLLADYIACNINNSIFCIFKPESFNELHFTTYSHKSNINRKSLECRISVNKILVNSIFTTFNIYAFKIYLEGVGKYG